MTVDGYEAMSRTELLATIRRDRAELDALVEQAADRIEQPGAAGDWSVKDVIAHICAYERWLAGLLGGQVRRLPDPPPGVDMNDVQQRNVWLHSLDRDRSVEDIRAEARGVHQHVVALVEARSEEDLQTAYTFGPNENLVPAAQVEGGRPRWPLWRWVVDSTFDHYRQHIPSLRAWLGQG